MVPYHMVPHVTLWYHMVSYDTIWHQIIPYGIIWYHRAPYGTIRYHMVPYGTIWYHMVPYGTIWYFMVPYGTILYHMVAYGTIWYRRSDGRTVGCQESRHAMSCTIVMSQTHDHDYTWHPKSCCQEMQQTCVCIKLLWWRIETSKTWKNMEQTWKK